MSYTNEELNELKKQQIMLKNMLDKETDNRARSSIQYQLRILKEQLTKYSNTVKREYSY